MITSGRDWLDVSAYSRPRGFRDPLSEIEEEVGIKSCVWTALFGPLFLWKKGARGLAVLMLLTLSPLLKIDAEYGQLAMSLREIPYLSIAIWAAWVVLTPMLLVMHYRGKGWIEIR